MAHLAIKMLSVEKGKGTFKLMEHLAIKILVVEKGRIWQLKYLSLKKEKGRGRNQKANTP